MDDDPPKENPATDFNKLDLSQLQGFSFGTQWTQDKGASSDRRDRSDRPRGDPHGSAPDRRDRRMFRKPADGPGGPSREGGGPQGGPGSGPGSPAPGSSAPPRRDGYDDRGPRRDGGDSRGEYRGDPRGESRGEGRGEYRGFPRRGGPGGEAQEPRGPYESPYISAVFYPEDASFNALVKTIRTSSRTIELFEIARTVIGKSDRFVVVISRRVPMAPPGTEPAAPGPLFLSVPDGLPFESEEAAISHVLARHLGQFYDVAEVEVDPPKGNFQVVNRCGITGELLGPPNYHRYTQTAQQHHANRLAGRMSFEAFRSRIESVRDPALIAQWLEKMKKVTRYTWKQTVEGQPVVAVDSLEEARGHLLAQARDRVVKAVDSVRLHGKAIETLPAGEIRRAVEGALERQIRFPLDTANVLRGRLRREHFTIFKKGSKGVSYVCAVKRKFRVPGQVFSDSIGSLISFVEAHPMVKAGELGEKFLGIRAPADGSPPPAADREKVARTHGDLVWLVREGYVTEFIDGGLYAPPAMVESRKKEAEASENDPENFPEAPPASVPAPAAHASAPAEEPAAATPAAEENPAPVSGTATAAEAAPVPAPFVEGTTAG